MKDPLPMQDQLRRLDQLAGHVLEKVVDARLPGSSNTTSFPNPFAEPVIPDHLPPGQSSVFLDSQGRKATAGQRFSARFVGDSKYRTSIPVEEQTRGFVNLAKFTDAETLVFYVRWQEKFPAAERFHARPRARRPGIAGPALECGTRGPGIARDGWQPQRDDSARLGSHVEMTANSVTDGS